MRLCIAGDAGGIGGHTCLEFFRAGYLVAGVDNLRNGKRALFRWVTELCGETVQWRAADLLERRNVYRVFEENALGAVGRFVGLSAVGELASWSPNRSCHCTTIVGSLTLRAPRHSVRICSVPGAIDTNGRGGGSIESPLQYMAKC